MKTTIKLLVGFFLAIGAINAQATLSYCNSKDGFGADDRTPTGGDPDNSVNGWTDPTALTTGDMIFRNTPADNCYGVASGNEDASTMNTIWEGAWTLLAKDNTPDGDDPDPLESTVEGVKFTLAVVPQDGATTGTWTLSWSEVADPGLPITMDIAGVLKASNQYSTYLFLDQEFTTDPLTGEGSFNITFFNNGDQVPNLSHLSLYYRDVTSGDGVPGEGTPGEGSGVPEPSTLALLGLGMIGGLFVRRQRAKQA